MLTSRRSQEKLAIKSKSLFEPDDHKTYFFLGQDLGTIGGMPGYTSGYMDQGLPLPVGFTTYTNMDLQGLTELANWGAGDVFASRLVSHPMVRNPMLNIGLTLKCLSESDRDTENLDQVNDNTVNDKLQIVGDNVVSKIAQGKFDHTIRMLGLWLKRASVPVFLRIGFEFNNPWTSYEPKSFILAYRRIVDMLRKQGVSNVAFVWQSDGRVAEYDEEHFMQWYPGDDYVDWMGYTHFRAMQGVSENVMLCIAREKGKPLFISEATPLNFDLEESNGIKAWDEYFVPLFKFIEENGDVVKALAYINLDWPSQPMWSNLDMWAETDGRIQVNEFVKKSWSKELGENSRWILADC